MTARDVGALIDRQIRRWELQQPRPEAPAAPRPCVAMSRLPWALGGTIGRAVAERLDYGFFSRELLDQIAAERGVQRRMIAGLDEQVLGTIDRVVADLFHLRPLTESDYLRHVARTMATLARRGASVIVGRGAPFLLPPQTALRVLVVAPADVRASRLAEAESLSPDVATKRLAELDAKRRGFARHQFGLDQEDPVLYDLVLSTGWLEVDAAADLIVLALRRRFPGAAGEAPARA